MLLSVKATEREDIMAIHSKATKRVIANGVTELAPFRAASMSGRAIGEFDDNAGRMPEPAASEFKAAVRSGRVDYAVYSYGTPIAWHHKGVDTWTLSGEHYSVTTSNHQSLTRLAITHGWC